MHYLQRRTVPGTVKEELSLSGNIPCVLLGRFGVDSRFRGEKYRANGGISQGPLLIREAIAQAMNDDLVKWYAKQGFASMPKNPRNMALDLKKH